MRLPEDASSQPVFGLLQQVSDFYEHLSFGIMGFRVGPLAGMFNFDSYLMDSIGATVLSIRQVLLSGRVADAYMLLRKYNDSIVINAYENVLFLQAEDKGEIVEQRIDDWVNGKSPLPAYKEMNKAVLGYPGLQVINDLLSSEKRYARIRKRCNDFCHANYFAYMQLNSDIVYPNFTKLLEQFRGDMVCLAAMHFSQLFTLRPFYMSSSDYIDALEAGMTPEPDSQHLVAPFIQKYFDDIVKRYYPGIAQEMISSTYMKLA